MIESYGAMKNEKVIKLLPSPHPRRCHPYQPPAMSCQYLPPTYAQCSCQSFPSSSSDLFSMKPYKTKPTVVVNIENHPSRTFTMSGAFLAFTSLPDYLSCNPPSYSLSHQFSLRRDDGTQRHVLAFIACACNAVQALMISVHNGKLQYRHVESSNYKSHIRQFRHLHFPLQYTRSATRAVYLYM